MSINIKKKNKGKFTASAKAAGEGVQEHAHKVMSNPKATTLQKRRANFAIQAKKWHHAQDGASLGPQPQNYNDMQEYYVALGEWANSQADVLKPVAIEDNEEGRIPGLAAFLKKKNSGMSTNPFKSTGNEGTDSNPMGRGSIETTPQIKPPKKWGNTALAIMAGVDALLPNGDIEAPVVWPKTNYNANQYGTGSQAIAKNGIELSTTGYKANSKDKNKPKLRIPSNIITMKNVPHPVIGTGSDGSQQLMMPEQEYFFPNAEYVDEQPLAQRGAIITNNPNDPRLKAYNDSLKTYQLADAVQRDYFNGKSGTPIPFSKKPQFSSANAFIEGAYGDYTINTGTNVGAELNRLAKRSKIKPYGQYVSPKGLGDQLPAYYKKPVQPVVYQKPAQAPVKKRQPTYQDSLILSKTKTYLPVKGTDAGYQKEIDDIIQSGRVYGSNLFDDPKVRAAAKRLSGTGNEYDIKPIWKKVGNRYEQTFKKPVGTPQPQKPIFKRPEPNPITPIEFNPSNVSSIVPLPNMQRAEWDASKPTPFVFTNATGNYLEGKNTYFPDEQSLRKFAESQKNVSMQSSNGGATATGYLKSMKKGGKMGKKYISKSYENGGELEVEGNQFQPISSETLVLKGPSHKNGGIEVEYAGKRVEAEGGEPVSIGQDGSAIIYGNMKNPITGNKFKTDAMKLAKKEAKVNKLMDYSTALVNNADPYDKWESLKFNAGNAMMRGAKLKADQLKSSKEHLSELQQAMLELKNEGLKTAENGMKLPKAQMGMRVANTVSRRYQELLKKGVQNLTLQDWIDLETIEKIQKRSSTDSLPQSNSITPPVTESNVASIGPLKQSMAQRHNNPGNMKFEKWMEKYGATPGELDNITKDGTRYAQFPDMESGITAMQTKMFDRPTYGNRSVKDAVNLWTGNVPYSKLPQDLVNRKMNSLSAEERKRVFDAFTMGEDSKAYNWDGTTAESRMTNTMSPTTSTSTAIKPPKVDMTPFGAGRVQAPIFTPQPSQPPKAGIQVGQYDWTMPPLPKPIPSGTDAEALQFEQILPEIYAGATNQEDPVWMQQFQPDLFQPYQVSLQDRRNRITSQGRASRQYLGDNANAQATLAAGEYDAINNVDAEEFRINQGIGNDIINKNIALLNESQLTNLELADQQYVRQNTARSKTKAANQDILNSLSNKVLQNRLENRTLQTYENLYPHFRFGDDFVIDKVGNPGQDYLNTSGLSNPTSKSYATSTTNTYDGTGTLKQIKTLNPSQLDVLNKEALLQTKKQRNMQKLFKDSRFNPF